MDNENVKINMDALHKLVENAALNKFIVSTADEDSRDYIYRFLMSANKHGVSTATMLNIITDCMPKGEDGYILPDDEDNEVAPY